MRVDASEPTILWRLCRAPGERARAVVLPGGPPHTVTFFVNDVLDRVENYDAMPLVVFRCDELRRGLLEDGWRDET